MPTEFYIYQLEMHIRQPKRVTRQLGPDLTIAFHYLIQEIAAFPNNI